MQVLLNTSPMSFTSRRTAVTTTQVGQSVIPPGTTLPPNATPPAQVGAAALSFRCCLSLPRNAVHLPFLLPPAWRFRCGAPALAGSLKRSLSFCHVEIEEELVSDVPS